MAEVLSANGPPHFASLGSDRSGLYTRMAAGECSNRIISDSASSGEYSIRKRILSLMKAFEIVVWGMDATFFGSPTR